MPLLNYTTEIAVEKTISEIEGALARAGASAILKKYDPEGQVSEIAFAALGAYGRLSYRLPARVDSAVKVLNRQVAARKIPRRYQNDRRQAARVAWRIVREWTLAQIALLELEQADFTELFLPFATGADGKTIGERVPDLFKARLLLAEPEAKEA